MEVIFRWLYGATVTLVVVLSCCCSSPSKCEDFRTGQFIYLDHHRTTRVFRNDSIQVEVDLKSGVQIYNRVEWVSDCSFELTYSNILNSPEDTSLYMGEKIYVEIVEMEGDDFTVHARGVVIDHDIRMRKVGNQTSWWGGW